MHGQMDKEQEEAQTLFEGIKTLKIEGKTLE